jgi:RimJ/RimL family protein N-acetyltransferase
LNPQDKEIIEIMYAVIPAARHQGYATEMPTTITDYTFDELGYDRAIAFILPKNEDSKQVVLRVKRERCNAFTRRFRKRYYQMMKNITHASPEDAAAILELQKLAYRSEAKIYNDFNIPPLTQTLDELRSDFTGKVFLKTQVEGKIVGSVRGYQAGSTCYIERLIVHPDFQGQGIGTTLMEQIQSFFGQAQRFELFTGHKSDRNIRLYERLGYKTFKSEEMNKTLSFVFMEKHK